jgi:hypothetical protein
MYKYDQFIMIFVADYLFFFPVPVVTSKYPPCFNSPYLTPFRLASFIRIVFEVSADLVYKAFTIRCKHVYIYTR